MTVIYFFYGLKNFDVKSDVILNRLEKYMRFILNKNLVFIDTMKFVNSNLKKLVKKLIRQWFQIFNARV